MANRALLLIGCLVLTQAQKVIEWLEQNVKVHVRQ
jgi:hypothetical protein